MFFRDELMEQAEFWSEEGWVDVGIDWRAKNFREGFDIPTKLKFVNCEMKNVSIYLLGESFGK